MKKTITILLSLLSLILGAVVLTGCGNNNEKFTAKSYHSGHQKVTSVNLDVRDRQVKVMPSPDRQIHLDYSQSSQEYYKIAVSAQHTLTMTAATNKKWTDYIGNKPAASSRKIVLQVPDKLLTTLKITTTNAEINLAPLTVKHDVLLANQGGEITFKQLTAGQAINLKNKNGNITGSITGGYDDYAISATVKKGKNNLPASKKGGPKKLTVANNNGDIAVELIK